MKKIAHVDEVKELKDLPIEIINVIQDAVTILDREYGEDRDVDSDYGGYVLVIESEGELGQLKEIGIDMESDSPEYVDTIICSDGQVFTSRLFLLGSDYGIIVIMPEMACAETLLDQ